MNTGNAVISLLVVLIILVVIFLIFREVFCWYWKINEIVAILNDIKSLLQSQGKVQPQGLSVSSSVSKKPQHTEKNITHPTAQSYSQSEESQVDDNYEYHIELMNLGENITNVIKVIRSNTSFDLQEAKDFIAEEDMVLVAASREEAAKIKKELEEAGATVEVKRVVSEESQVNDNSEYDINFEYHINFINLGDNMNNVINVICSNTTFDSKEAKDFITQSGEMILVVASKEEAVKIKKELDEAGATVELERVAK